MTGVSLRHRAGRAPRAPGRPRRAARRSDDGPPPARALGEPALGVRRYRAAGVTVDLDGLSLAGRRQRAADPRVPRRSRPGGRSIGSRRGPTPPALRASIVVDAPAFPFPHRIEVTAIAREPTLRIDTTIVPTGRRAVPVAFGWHPYLRLPGAPARSLASAPAAASASHARRPWHPDRRRRDRSRPSRRRSGGARSTTATRSVATVGSRSRRDTGAVGRAAVRIATTRSRRSGSRPVSRSSRSSR